MVFSMKRKKKSGSIVFIVIIVLIFCFLGGVVYSIERKISAQMSEAAIENLSENLELLKGTIQAILNKEAEFQSMLADELALLDEPEEFIRSDHRNKTMVKMSLIREGERTGISGSGEVFREDGLDFSAGNLVEGLSVSEAYVNDMGTWAYTMKCPVMKNGRKIATLYVEYIYDTFDDALPDQFYNSHALLYIMDSRSERFVLKPKGMGDREAGSLDLQDFYRANRILEPEIQDKVAQGIQAGNDLMFYHDILGEDSLIYMWSVNNASMYLIGFVPVAAIQKEGDAVNQNIFIVILVTLASFVICCILYYFNQRLQNRLYRERDKEREIHNIQLTEALQAAQIASKSKTMFLSNMSHDIRTPMNAILGFTILLDKDADYPDKVREYTKKITSSGRHLLSLINDVLDVSKIESGKVVLSMGEFTLNGMLSSVDAIIRPMAKAKRQNFDVVVTGIRHECLIGDETRLNQVLINLLSNAVKYTPEGGMIWLRLIGLKQRSEQYEHIRIEVEDNGYGMTPEYLEVIFDAFTRAENSTTNKVQGTGLGMAITKNIIELMGGTIEVASEVDHGTIFTAELELRIPEEMVAEQFWQECGISHILAVDDDQAMCGNIQIRMQDVGVSTDVAYSGEEALEKVKRMANEGGQYDVILLDWKMPGIDGFETARQIRSLMTQHIPMFLLTACDGEEVEKEACDAEFDGLMEKPFFVTAFKEKIRCLRTKCGQMQHTEEKTIGNLQGLYFLIAEDNEINSEILLELLHIDGADGEVAENGRLAVERFEAAQPGYFDAVLMDVQMPEMNGYEATKKIRELDRSDAKTIPIIAMTANAFAEDVKDARDAGMDDHIAKPVDMEIIRNVLSKYL
uniref:Circadian input-output histidine kinase CikA n=1 Tax=Eubacterium plexicaudatum ASF492 TaxID=1235802 RepID=N2ARS7_9FIRM